MIVGVRLGIGVLLVGILLWLHGETGKVLEELRADGWLAVAAMSSNHLIAVALCGVAWFVPFADARRGTWKTFVLARWIRDAINQILPLVPLGGEVLGARVVINHGFSGPSVAALTIVDVTAEMLSQIVFSLIGVAFWLARHRADGLPHWVWIGLLLLLPMVGGLVLAQKLGLVRLLERIADKLMPEAWRRPEESRSIHDLLIAFYARSGRFFAAVVVHLAAWFAATLGVWMALRIIGHPLGWDEVVSLETVIYAVRAVAFLVPAALGVQEGAYLLAGAAFGLPPEAALALALIKRGREISLGLPALLTWQLLGRRTLRPSGS